MRFVVVSHSAVYMYITNYTGANIHHIGKWNNLFSATLKVTNTCQENLAITDVYGEYMNEGNIIDIYPTHPCYLGY